VSLTAEDGAASLIVCQGAAARDVAWMWVMRMMCVGVGVRALSRQRVEWCATGGRQAQTTPRPPTPPATPANTPTREAWDVESLLIERGASAVGDRDHPPPSLMQVACHPAAHLAKALRMVVGHGGKAREWGWYSRV
jgi:hypothetical protein